MFSSLTLFTRSLLNF
uniref:Uncharacterized protein n=1 Tax=Anguilla anguilla TaxID=7936 RepID=A0A0E9SCI7_ANGAN